MITNAENLVKLQNAVKQMIADGRTQAEIDSVLNAVGETPESMRSIGQYGAENVARARQSVQENKEEQSSIGHRAAQAAEIAGESLKAGAEGALWGLENVLQGTTGSAYGWLNKKIGGNYNNRTQEMYQLGKDMGVSWLPKVSKGVAYIGGAIRNPLYAVKAIPAGSKAANIMSVMSPKYGEAARNILNAAAAGGLAQGVESGFESDWNAENILKGAKRGAKIGAYVGTAGEVLKEFLPSFLGATTKTSKETMKEVRSAGQRKSKAFYEGRKLEPEDLISEATQKTRELKQQTSDALIKGKKALGSAKVDVDKLNKGLNKSIPKAVEQQPGAQKEFLDKARQAYDDFMNTKRTLADLDRFRQNIYNINTKGDKVAQTMQKSMYDATKTAGDLATAGKYSKVLKPAEEASNVLRDINSITGIEKAAGKSVTPGTMQQVFNKIVKSSKTSSGLESMKKVFGQEFVDKLVGNMTKEWFGKRAAWELATAALGHYTGNPIIGLGMASLGSPRAMSGLLYKGSQLFQSVPQTTAVVNAGINELFNKGQNNGQ